MEPGAAGRMKATDRGRGLPGHGAVGAQGVVGHQFLGKMASDARLQSAGSYKRHSKLLALGFADLTFSPGGRIVRRAIGDPFSPPRSLPIDTVQQEQAWNTLQMAEPVTAPRFRVWTYRDPAIVLGCSQRALHAEAARRMPQGMDVLVRPSGGGAVLTGPWMVSASVALPLTHPWVRGRLPDSYRDLGQLHVDVLAALGVAGRALPESEVAAANAHLGPVVGWACYGSLAPWEVVDAAGRKLVGLAQRRQRTGVLLVAGTLATVPDWPLLCGALGHPDDVDGMQRRTVSCDVLADRPWDAALYARRLHAALERALGE